ncbi:MULTISPECIES: DUF4236 domain-containing protein [unclassified Flavobacterium]|uniref:DUF4236 domain-containing protein n=1 Tax=unclassified Flavobacterium TaxID=196869 RepID=UPI001F131F4E|nr:MULTISPECIES: DUF4236 domain-containing protein [unclassified Flavobacterium]UMY65278.1 DUF4236 domain-containing protein [Flavobacterium sp. HJ-32-4]
MGLQFNRRIRLGKNIGLNISKSGISPSIRTKFGSVSNRGFSVRTGIKGLSYRKTIGKGSGCLLVVAVVIGWVVCQWM